MRIQLSELENAVTDLNEKADRMQIEVETSLRSCKLTLEASRARQEN